MQIKIKEYRFLIIGIIILIIYFGIVFTVFSAAKPTEEGQWTIPALKEYFDQRLTAMDLAITKAETATEKRFEGVNEFRNTLADQQRTFVPREEYESGHIQLHTEVSELKTRFDKVENMKQGGNVIWAYVISGISLMIGIIAIKDKIIKR